MLTTDFIEKLGINETQVTELNSFIDGAKLDETQQNALQAQLLNINAELRKNYDGAANTNAEKILDGAAQKVEQLTGFKRQQGQKIADYFVEAGSKHVSAREQKLTEREKVLEEKIKNGNTDETVKAELAQTKEKLNSLLQIEAEYEKVKDLSVKYPELETKYNSMKINNAFSSVKPSFPVEVNPYESAAKWKEFISNVQEKYTIEINAECEAIAIDKENQYKIVKLSELVKSNKEITELTQGRQQQGIGHKKNNIKLEGIPFNLPENASSEDIQKAIKEYLLGEKKLQIQSPEYANQFASLNTQIYKLKNPQKTA